MYKCNKCGAFFERPEEKEIESENYARPFGDGSEPFGGGYYTCCPECGCEDFDRYDEEDGLEIKWGFMDRDNNLVEIPLNIQKHMEAREKFWLDKIKDIYNKCGLLLEKLALTEKALELACKYGAFDTDILLREAQEELKK